VGSNNLQCTRAFRSHCMDISRNRGFLYTRTGDEVARPCRAICRGKVQTAIELGA
jgi:hypothetical protein